MTAASQTSRRARRPGPALIALLAAVVVLFCVLVPVHTALYGTSFPVAFVLGLGMCASPLLVLISPRTGGALFCLTAILLPLVVGPGPDQIWPWPWSVPAMLVFVLFVLAVSAVHGWRSALPPWLIGLLVPLAAPLIRTDVGTRGTAGIDAVVTAAITAAALVVGVLLAGRIRLGEELTRERELSAAEQSRRVLIEERTRIARELHDVVAHSMSLIQVQASTARYRIPELPSEATEEFEDIARSARGSLAEMRRLLGVLRTEDQDAQLAPQQGLEDIPALVESARRAGVEVRLSTEPAPRELPVSVHIAAYRIAQEALSNAVRHAPGSAVELAQGIRDDAVTLVVRNGPPTSPEPGGPGSAGGHGLRGMRERAALLGGTLVAQPDPHGGWSVSAVLPFGPVPEESP